MASDSKDFTVQAEILPTKIEKKHFFSSHLMSTSTVTAFPPTEWFKKE